MSKKTKRDILIPDIKDITIFQSNRVTNAKYDYTLIQERVFTWVMYYLQDEIRQVMDGTSVTQLNIFSQLASEMLCMNIPMHHLGSPSQYRDIRDAIQKISGVQILMANPEKKTIKWSGLFSSVEMPDRSHHKRSAMVTIEIRRDVAQMLIDVNYTKGRPEQYTKYMLHVALQAKFKYTSKIYKLLCSYRERRYYSCSIEDLRDHLQIPDNVYPNFNDLKRFVLDPVAKELKEIADIYFDTADPEFTNRVGRKVVAVKITLLFPMSEELFNKKIQIFTAELIRSFGCRESHLQQIRHLLTIDCNWKVLDDVVSRCYYLCEKREVQYPAAFVIKSILNGVAPV